MTAENFETEYVPGAAAFPRDPMAVPPAGTELVIDEATIRRFCGFLSAALPELHRTHPERVYDAWTRFKSENWKVVTARGQHARDITFHENRDGR